MKILVIGPSWVGDMMMSQSLYRTLQQRHPGALIDVMAPAWCRPLLARMPEVANAVPMPLGHGVLALSERRQLGKKLAANGYDQACVLPGSFKSALVPFFAGIKKRTGWRGEMRYGLLNDLRVLDKNAFPLMVQRYVALAYPAHALQSAADLLQPLLWPQLQVEVSEQHERAQHFMLSAERAVIGFCPGAEFGPAKRWPHYHYAALASQLIDAGYQVILFGSANDQQTGELIRSDLSAQQQLFCRNLAGETTLDDAVVLLSQCQAVVSNDSGLMHIAAALDRPLVALYGPSSPDFTPPLSQHARVIRLISGYQRIRRGEADEGYHQSLIDITPQQVFNELSSLLTANQEKTCVS